MLSFCLKDVRGFSKILAYCKEFDQKQCRLIASEDGIHIQTMDSSHTSIADMFLPASYFASYSIDTPKDVAPEDEKSDAIDHADIHIPILLVYDFIKGATVEEVTFKSVETKNNMFAYDKIRLSVASDDGFTAEMEFKTLRVLEDVYEIPDMEPDCTFEVSVPTMKKWLKYIPKRCDLAFKPSTKSLTLECVVDENKSEISEKQDYLTFKNPHPVFMGSLNCLKIFKLLDFGEPIEIKMVNDGPLQCSVEVSKSVYVNAFFAPKITDDELENEGMRDDMDVDGV
jgi:hypothetical protein